MSKEATGAAAIGLDIGTSRIVTARRAGQTDEFNTQLNAFVDLPWSKLTQTTLRRENVPHVVDGERIFVHGSESARFANLIGVETRRSMSRGVLNPSEPESLKQIRHIIEHALGAPEKPGERLCFSVPAAVPGQEETFSYHEASLSGMLTEMGYSVRSINEGLAVVYSELEATNYTGIGISFGGGLCNVCLAYLSVPVVSFSVPKAGDYIDANAAAATGDLVNRIRLRKEDAFYFNGYFGDKSLQALTVYYEDMIASVVARMKERFSAACSSGPFRKPVTVVVSGGSALPKGFRERFETTLRASEFPLPISEVRTAASPMEATARGALIAALSEIE